MGNQVQGPEEVHHWQTVSCNYTPSTAAQPLSTPGPNPCPCRLVVDCNNQVENAAMDSQQPSLVKPHLPSAPNSSHRQSSLLQALTNTPTTCYHSDTGLLPPVVDRNNQPKNAAMDSQRPSFFKLHLPSASDSPRYQFSLPCALATPTHCVLFFRHCFVLRHLNWGRVKTACCHLRLPQHGCNTMTTRQTRRQ